MAIELNDKLSNCPHIISWFDNLKKCVARLLLHPIMPLDNPGFSYRCLFSRSNYCCLADECSTNEISLKTPLRNYLDLFMSNIDWGISNIQSYLYMQRLSRDKVQDPPQTWTTMAKELIVNLLKITKTNPLNRVFLLSQLLLCSILLSIVVIHDLNALMCYSRIPRPKS